MEATDNQGEHWQDLFPAAPKAEKESGFTMKTWYGFEVVLPHSLVTPDPNYVQTAPDAVGLQKRRLQSRSSEETYGNVDLATAIRAVSTGSGSLAGIAAAFTAAGGSSAAEQSAEQPPQAMTWSSVAAMVGGAVINHVASILLR